ncbi:MAG: DNA translocase FtsK 4TM domain-containing protein, partial [Candidatus Omnitrophica bacterium]|nr:DNA translocase FtsK 4TM domain-containing protein [Candidatus Omnitrophota bacterium]
MKSEHLNEIKGIIILAFALILFASLISYIPEDLPWFTSHPNVPVHNFIRIAGAYTAGSLFFLFGYSAYFFAVFMFFWSWNIFTNREMKFTVARLVSLSVLVLVMSGLFSLTGPGAVSSRFARGGMAGFSFADFFAKYFGVMGAYIIFFALASLCLVVTAEFLVSPLFVRLTRGLIDLVHQVKEEGLASLCAGWTLPWMKDKKAVEKPGKKIPKAYDADEVEEDDVPVEALVKGKKEKELLKEEKADKKTPPSLKAQAPNIRIVQPKTEPLKEREDKPLIVGSYQFPPFDLLKDPQKISDDNVQEVLASGAKTLEQTLESFGVTVRVVDIERGPVITRYELEPAAGVRVQSINSLADDIALAMQASSVRIQAPIPGKNRVGIEVPNGLSAAVVLKDVLIQGDIRNAKSKIMLALGKDTAGKPIVADLAEMPHLLVAGATGAGKSVCLNV